MTDGRRRIVGSLMAVVLAVAAGCSGDDDGLPEGLQDISETEPADPEPEVDDEPSEPDEPEADAEPDPADDGSEDADEPDESDLVSASGVHVPESAFQINEDLDLDEEAQRRHLQFVLDAYLYAADALHTGAYDDAEVRKYYAWERLEGVLGSLHRHADAGLSQINDGTTVEFARMLAFDGGGAVVVLCVTPGPEAGTVNRSTGEYEFLVEEPHRLLGYHLALVEGDDEKVDWRIVDSGAPQDVACP